MVARYLITTADERTWPSSDKPVLFLGEWCRLYDRKKIWQKYDAQIVPYHWDDRNKLFRDYGCLMQLYEKLLNALAGRLNEIHQVDHSLRYWRILVGPWLGQFIPMVFDRWEMVQSAAEQYEIAGTCLIENDLERLVPNNMVDFSDLYGSDRWNQAIYGYLLDHWTDIPREWINERSSDTLGGSAPVPRKDAKRCFKRFVAGMVSKVLATCVNPNEAFFIADYLPLRQSFALQQQLGQIPRLWRTIKPVSAVVNNRCRSWRLDQNVHSDFEQALRDLIPLQIPTLYLEGYEDLKKQMSALPWPRCPRFIFTSVLYNTGDVFKAWTAQKVEEGSPLIIGQHGGSFGTTLWDFTEDHQLAISDAWISWGWENEENKKIRPVGNLKMVGRKIKWDPKGCALMVEMAMPRYSQRMYSVPVSSQWLDYFEDQSSFVAALPPNIRKQLLVRLYIHDGQWCQKQRWRDRYPELSLDDGIRPIRPLIEKSRIYICTYNATTFLESLAMNIPTLMFWNPKYWEMRESAWPYFDRLETAGIYHKTPESAAAKMAQIWDDVPGWWSRSDIQQERNLFCNRFSRMPAKAISVLKDVLSAVRPTVGNAGP